MSLVMRLETAAAKCESASKTFGHEDSYDEVADLVTEVRVLLLEAAMRIKQLESELNYAYEALHE